MMTQPIRTFKDLTSETAPAGGNDLTKHNLSYRDRRLLEQNARYALETASRGYVMQTGTIIAAGSCTALREDKRVREAYLGRGITHMDTPSSGPPGA